MLFSALRQTIRGLVHRRRFSSLAVCNGRLEALRRHQDRSHRQQSRGLRIGSGASSATSSRSLSPVTRASA